MQMLRWPRALLVRGRPKNRYYTPPFVTHLFHHHSFPIPCISLSPSHSLYPSSFFFSTVESLKWQHIKHLGTEAPWALINASLVPKRIISRREWVLDGWRSSTNEIKISFLTQESFYGAISKITKDLNPFTFIFLWHNWELNLLPRDALMDIIINHPFFLLLLKERFGIRWTHHLWGLSSAVSELQLSQRLCLISSNSRCCWVTGICPWLWWPIYTRKGSFFCPTFRVYSVSQAH